MTPREAALLVWALAECGHPSRALLVAANAAYGDLWHMSLGYFELARLVYSFGMSGFYPVGVVNRVGGPPSCKADVPQVDALLGGLRLAVPPALG
jgi:hypothetical protein